MEMVLHDRAKLEIQCADGFTITMGCLPTGELANCDTLCDELGIFHAHPGNYEGFAQGVHRKDQLPDLRRGTFRTDTPASEPPLSPFCWNPKVGLRPSIRAPLTPSVVA